MRPPMQNFSNSLVRLHPDGLLVSDSGNTPSFSSTRRGRREQNTRFVIGEEFNTGGHHRRSTWPKNPQFYADFWKFDQILYVGAHRWRVGASFYGNPGSTLVCVHRAFAQHYSRGGGWYRSRASVYRTQDFPGGRGHQLQKWVRQPIILQIINERIWNPLGYSCCPLGSATGLYFPVCGNENNVQMIRLHRKGIHFQIRFSLSVYHRLSWNPKL